MADVSNDVPISATTDFNTLADAWVPPFEKAVVEEMQEIVNNVDRPHADIGPLDPKEAKSRRRLSAVVHDSTRMLGPMLQALIMQCTAFDQEA
ncbi:hypothetical protein LTR42_011454 [Elasticomyces elasticus]|nr:hypothetical protein LTR42_011454 [Elasticomyces elasticus]